MARALPYVGIDAEWEARQLRAFQQLARGAAAAHGSFADFLFGRLLEEDLHVSCSPMLPPSVDCMHGMTIQGMCILQIVDIANIGANFEHRKGDAKGPTRTLKICFTDGHQLVFGFEYRWLPSFSMELLHGTKANVDVRHGLLLLTPQNCRLLGLSGNEMLEQARKSTADAQQPASTGAYSAALKTTQFPSAPTTPRESHASSAAEPPRHPVAVHSSASSEQPHWHSRASPAHAQSQPQVEPQTHHSSAPSVTTAVTAAAPHHSIPPGIHAPTQAAATAIAAKPPPSVTPPVFVDVVSSDGDCDSDDTDPMVQHLFYSPNTPRVVPESEPANERRTRPRKRPRDATSTATVITIDDQRPTTNVSASASVSASVPTPMQDARGARTDIAGSGAPWPSEPRPPPPPHRFEHSGGSASHHMSPTAPFQYFSARRAPLSAAANAVLDDVVHIRACIKSVAGFQFHTGLYLLQVVIEDCTATKQVAVDAAFVETLMGVSCLEFMRAMQKTPSVAHQWAARMQFALMTLEGVMAFRMNPNGTFTLLGCRDVTRQDAHALLQRVQATMTSR